MRPLTDMQAAWVREVVANGNNGAQAAISAGYSPASAAQRAAELRNLPHVMAAVQTELRKSFTDLAVLAMGQAKMMLLDPKTPASARTDLIKTLWDRAGLGPPKGDEDDEPTDLRGMSLAQLEAIAVRATFRPAQDVPSVASGPLLEGVSVVAGVDGAPDGEGVQAGA